MGRIFYEKTPLDPQDLQKPEEIMLIGSVIKVEERTFTVEFLPSLENDRKQSHFFIMDRKKVFLFEYDALEVFNSIGFHLPLEDTIIWAFDLDEERFVIQRKTAHTFEVVNINTTRKYDTALDSKIRRVIKPIEPKERKEIYDVTMDFLLHPWRFRATEDGRPLEDITRLSDAEIEIVEAHRNKKIRKQKEADRKKLEKRNRDLSRRLQRLQTLKIS